MAIRILATFPKTADLKGKSTFKDQPDTTEVFSFGWGVVSDARDGVTQGAHSVQNLTIHKRVDQISAILMLYAAKGTHIPEVVLNSYHKDRTGKEAIFSTLTLMDAVVTSVVTNESGSGDTGSESVSFDYAQIKLVAFGKTHTDVLRVIVGEVKLVVRARRRRASTRAGRRFAGCRRVGERKRARPRRAGACGQHRRARRPVRERAAPLRGR